MRNLKPKVKAWGEERGLDDPQGQVFKLMEELGELYAAHLRDAPKEELVDAIGDSEVVLIIYANASGIDPVTTSPRPDFNPGSTPADILDEVVRRVSALSTRHSLPHPLTTSIGNLEACLALYARHHDTTLKACLEHAWNEIKNRSGETRDGVFVKEEDVEP